MPAEKDKSKDSLWTLACNSVSTVSSNASSTSVSKAKPNLRSLLILGSEGVGKTELLTHFFERNDSYLNKTLALDYTFGRRAGRSLEKNIVNIWELGGGTTLLPTVNSVISVAAETTGLANLTIIIMIDLSTPNKLWTTLESMLNYVRATINKQKPNKFPNLTQDLRSQAWERVGGDSNPDKDCFDPFPLPLIIIGGKYDLFQNFETEKKKVVCRSLRYIAHSLGATLQFYSTRDVGLVKKAKDLLALHGFGHNIVKSISQDYNKPLLIPAGSDSIQQIGSSFNMPATALTAEWGAAYFQSNFPQDALEEIVLPSDPGNDVDFREMAIDKMKTLKSQVPKDSKTTQPSIKNKTADNLKQSAPTLPEPEQSQQITDTSVAQQFEAELCWCIQQLQRALTTAKMNQKQNNDALRSLNVLKNNSAPLVKKRQIMRSTFGDYRIKMAEEENSFKKAKSHIKFNTSSPSKKSQFLKRSAVCSTVIKRKELELSDNSFRFNFKIPDEIVKSENGTAVVTSINSGEDMKKETVSETKQIEVNSSQTISQNFRYKSSDNSFRFGFLVEESSDTQN